MVLSAVLMWSFSFPLIKIALENGVPPITLAALRSLIFIPILIILFIKHGKNSIPSSRKDWIGLLAIGIFTIILPNIFQNIGMTYTTASVSSIIQTSGPIFTIILAVLFLRELLNLKKITGAIVALIGTLLIIISNNGAFTLKGLTVYGNSLILLSSFSYAISSIITKKELKRIYPLQMLGFSTLIGFVGLIIISIVEEPQRVIINISIDTWLVIFLLALFPSFIAILLWFEVMVHEEISRLIIFMYLMPVFAVVFSYIFLGETISLLTIIFATLVIGGIALAQKK